MERETPVTEKTPLKSKKGLYRIRDEFFQFWFRFIFPGKADLEMDKIESVLQRIKQDMPGYLGLIYEKVAGDIVMENMDLFFPIERLGRWWDRFDEVDLVGLSHKENSLLCAEVKWSRNLVGENVFRELKAKSERIPWGNRQTRRCYALFSRSGFTQRMLALAEKEDVVLFKGEERIK